MIVFPKVSKYKLIVGKYIGNLILVFAIIASYYLMIGIIGLYYCGGSSNNQIFYSFGIALLYACVLCSFITFFSSFLKSTTYTIVLTIIYLFVLQNILVTLITSISLGRIEPLYSFTYLGSLVTNILSDPFPDPRYQEFIVEGVGTYRTWTTPSVGMGITMLLIYFAVFFILAALLFKRREL